jgi:predicted dehydrogenase
MKLLFVGLGGVGQRHLRNSLSINPGTEIHSYRERGLTFEISNDLKTDTTTNIDEKYNITNHPTFISAISASPDAVIISNPSSMHFEIFSKCIKNKIPCFIEKPLAVSTDGLSEILLMAEESNLTTMVGFQLRFNPVIKELKRIIDNKELGNILSFRAEVCEYMPGFHPYEDYRNLYCSKKELGGGVVLTQIHELDLIIYLFGTPEKVMAYGGKLSSLDIDVEDSVDILMQKDNLSLSLRMDYLQNPRRRSGVIYGENDWVEYDLVNLKIEFGSGKKLSWDDFDRNNMFIDEMKDFFKSVEKNRDSSIPIKEGSKSLYLAEGILKSLNNKEEVEIEY